MKYELFQRTVKIERSAADVFAWHERPGALARLTPPWEHVEVKSQAGGIREGATVSLRTKAGPIWTPWDIVHRDYIEGRQFRDVQQRGPFAAWEHLHRFESAGDNACRLMDEVHFRLPLGWLGKWAGAGWVRRKLERGFAYRHAVTQTDLEMVPPERRRCVLISGASGVVGHSLIPFLQTQGHSVRRLVRGRARGGEEFFWNPTSGEIDPAAWVGVDAVVHLSGENVAGGRWTQARRAAIVASRIEGTRTLARAIERMSATARPEVVVSASAVGFYGERGDETLAEDATCGGGFLADVCVKWESELVPIERLGVRTVALRTGVVLTPAGGALAKLLPAFRAMVGGRMGSGRQWMSWITPDDLGAMYLRAIEDVTWRGAFNAVSPSPVRNADFAALLGRVLHRPAVVPVPALALRMMFGQMAEETVLMSTRVQPERALQAGFRWRHAELEEALRHVLGVTD